MSFQKFLFKSLQNFLSQKNFIKESETPQKNAEIDKFFALKMCNALF